MIATNDYPAEIVAALRALRDEITGGVIRLLDEETDDREFWDEHAREHVGKSWLDVPWYWAEAFFYRRVLEAVRYFQSTQKTRDLRPGEFNRRDPFAPQKCAELAPDRAPRTLLALLEHLPCDDAGAFRALVHASLWGNRADLSMQGMIEATSTDRSLLLVDDTERVREHLTLTHALSLQRRGSLHFICDNAGTELAFDLALADFLLHERGAQQIVFHLKSQPFFVSDAMIQDVVAVLDAIGQSSAPVLRQFAQRLATALAEGHFVLSDHPFWITGFFFHAMPDDLRAMLSQATLVISKGDANYRRLIGDCHWEPTASFEAATEYFAAPIVALRTLKAELIVGLRDGEVERLRAEDPNWLINGKRGVVQAAGLKSQVTNW